VFARGRADLFGVTIMSADVGVRAASGAAAAARRGGSSSLEQFQNHVTHPTDEFTLVPCGCDCWFCPKCCKRKGYNLRARLVPILESFRARMMLSLTVDPVLFESPKHAYLYLRHRRAISRTMQDMWRWGHLHSRRYAYVLEFQRETRQPHFHLLCDASFIPHDALMAAWGKHRPPSAGPVAPNRPALGYCWISMPSLATALHAARYATKYLVKAPDDGFPAWVLQMGKDHRVPRFQPSRGFWGNPPLLRPEPESTRTVLPRTYEDRLGDCGITLNMFQTVERIDASTGVVTPSQHWRGRLDEPTAALALLGADIASGRCKVTLRATDSREAAKAISAAVGHPVRFLHGPVGGEAP